MPTSDWASAAVATATSRGAEVRPRRFGGSTMGHLWPLSTTGSSFALAGLALLPAGPTARAQQFVLFDATFTYTREDADNAKPSKSHYYVRDTMLNPDRPKDWT